MSERRREKDLVMARVYLIQRSRLSILLAGANIERSKLDTSPHRKHVERWFEEVFEENRRLGSVAGG